MKYILSFFYAFIAPISFLVLSALVSLSIKWFFLEVIQYFSVKLILMADLIINALVLFIVSAVLCLVLRSITYIIVLSVTVGLVYFLDTGYVDLVNSNLPFWYPVLFLAITMSLPIGVYFIFVKRDAIQGKRKKNVNS